MTQKPTHIIFLEILVGIKPDDACFQFFYPILQYKIVETA